MFRVENADFIANKLATELLPNQEYREAFKNAHEAVERRIADDDLEEGAGDGRIELDNNSIERAMRPVCLSRKIASLRAVMKAEKTGPAWRH